MIYLFQSNKILSQFINFKTFPSDGVFLDMSYDDFSTLSPYVAKAKTYSLQQTETTLHLNWLQSNLHSEVVDTYAVGFSEQSLLS
jgi:hypothetical protein